MLRNNKNMTGFLQSILLSRVEQPEYQAFLGKRGKMEAKKEERCILNLLSPNPVGRPNTQAKGRKAKNLFRPCEGRQVVPKKISQTLGLYFSHVCLFSSLHGYSVRQFEYVYFTDSCFLSYPTVCDRIVLLSMKQKRTMNILKDKSSIITDTGNRDLQQVRRCEE